MSAARIAYQVIVVQVSMLIFVAACYWAGREHGWARLGDATCAVVAWFSFFGALGSLRRDKP